MHELLTEFRTYYQQLQELVDAFPQDKREEILFDLWSLKDVLAHLNHWAQHDITCLTDLQQAKIPHWEENTDEFNKEGVEKRKHWKWEKVYTEFITLGEKLMQTYETLPEELWKKKFWPNRKYTPLVFLEIDIDHYKNEHIPQLESLQLN